MSDFNRLSNKNFKVKLIDDRKLKVNLSDDFFAAQKKADFAILYLGNERIAVHLERRAKITIGSSKKSDICIQESQLAPDYASLEHHKESSFRITYGSQSLSLTHNSNLILPLLDQKEQQEFGKLKIALEIPSLSLNSQSAMKSAQPAPPKRPKTEEIMALLDDELTMPDLHHGSIMGNLKKLDLFLRHYQMSLKLSPEAVKRNNNYSSLLLVLAAWTLPFGYGFLMRLSLFSAGLFLLITGILSLISGLGLLWYTSTCNREAEKQFAKALAHLTTSDITSMLVEKKDSEVEAILELLKKFDKDKAREVLQKRNEIESNLSIFDIF